MLATVKEEGSGCSASALENADTDRLSDEASGNFHQETESEPSKETQSHKSKLGEVSGLLESDLGSDINISSHGVLENSSELRNVHVSTPEKEPCAPLTIPSIRNILTQQKDSFEMEEVQSTEEKLLTFQPLTS